MKIVYYTLIIFILNFYYCLSNSDNKINVDKVYQIVKAFKSFNNVKFTAENSSSVQYKGENLYTHNVYHVKYSYPKFYCEAVSFDKDGKEYAKSIFSYDGKTYQQINLEDRKLYNIKTPDRNIWKMPPIPFLAYFNHLQKDDKRWDFTEFMTDSNPLLNNNILKTLSKRETSYEFLSNYSKFLHKYKYTFKTNNIYPEVVLYYDKISVNFFDVDEHKVILNNETIIIPISYKSNRIHLESDKVIGETIYKINVDSIETNQKFSDQDFIISTSLAKDGKIEFID